MEIAYGAALFDFAIERTTQPSAKNWQANGCAVSKNLL
jgi:hypothetical protein